MNLQQQTPNRAMKFNTKKFISGFKRIFHGIKENEENEIPRVFFKL
jgi:hypothetical protein